MFPNCYLNHMNSGYRAMPPMPSPSMFPGGMFPSGMSQGVPSPEGPMQGPDMEGVEIIHGGTSAGAPTPGGIPGPTPSGVGAPGTVGVTVPSPFVMAPGSPVTQDTEYTQGYLRTQIGKRVRITFLLGTNTLQDRVGILQDVGISYVIIRDPATGTDVLGDIYSIKFVDIYPTAAGPIPGTI